MVDQRRAAASQGESGAARYSPTDVIYGPGEIHKLPAVVAAAGAKRVLLVCGGRSFEASGAAQVLPDLESVAAVERWSDYSPNTDSLDLARGLGVLRSVAPDMIVGVGGGSSMDMAKLLCAFADCAPPDVADAIAAAGPVETRAQGLVLAPTTSGSGSEATHFAVAYVGADKYSIGGPGLYADTAIVDPDLGRSGSPYQRATSGIDAVCQSIESLWAVGANDHSRRVARHALGLLLGSIERYVADPDDASSRAMSLGSHLAGRAIDVSKTTAAHALSYGISKRYGVSHGHAVALTLGFFIEAHAEAAPDALQDGVLPAAYQEAMTIILSKLGAASGAEARHEFVRLLHRIGLPSALVDVGLQTSAEIEELVDGANLQRLKNNPMQLDRDVLLDLLAVTGGPGPQSYSGK